MLARFSWHFAARCSSVVPLFNCRIRCYSSTDNQSSLAPPSDVPPIPTHNVASVTKQIEKYFHLQFFDKAKRLYKRALNDQQLELDAKFFNSVIHGCFTNKFNKAALMVIQDMETRAVEPTIETMNIILAFHVQMGEHQTALSMFHNLRNSAQLQPNVVTFNILLDYYSNKKDFKGMFDILHEMQRASVAPSFITFSILIKPYVLTNRFHDATKIFALAEKHCKMPTSTYNFMLLNIHDPEQSISFYHHMKEKDIQIDAQSIKAIVQNLLEGGRNDFETAVSLILENQGIGKTYLCNNMTQLIANYNGAQQAFHFFSDMIDNGTIPIATSFTILITAFKKEGNLPKVTEMWKMMKQLDVQPELSTYCSFIDAFLKHNRLETAERLFNEMIELQHIKPDRILLSLFLMYYSKWNMESKISKIYDIAHKYNIEMQPSEDKF